MFNPIVLTPHRCKDVFVIPTEGTIRGKYEKATFGLQNHKSDHISIHYGNGIDDRLRQKER